ncbi:hypothetical protein DIPPA_02364 [Diplonema papillatum]|nr:hypothetical protein DIPPA_02364 [Diplonema papillatum]
MSSEFLGVECELRFRIVEVASLCSAKGGRDNSATDSELSSETEEGGGRAWRAKRLRKKAAADVRKKTFGLLTQQDRSLDSASDCDDGTESHTRSSRSSSRRRAPHDALFFYDSSDACGGW